MIKQRNVTYFSCKVNGKEYSFKCYTTSTRCGFCHTVRSLDYDVRDTKVSYYNRTWERFDYETALKGMIRKFPKDWQDTMWAQLIERKAAEEHEKAEAFFGAFSALHSSLSDENKKRLADADIHIETEAQAHAVMGVMGLMALAQV